MTELSSLLPNIEIRFNEPMNKHTSFKIGGPVRAMVFPKNENELALTIHKLRVNNISFFTFGNGTNLLVAENPLDYIAVKTQTDDGGIKLITDTSVRVYSGALLSRLATFACDNDLAGLEFAHGIPGSAGGAVFMNAGAYGGEVGDYITSVTALMPDSKIKTFSAAECGFSYRHSVFCDNGAVVLGAVIKLNHGNKADIRAKMTSFAEQRREKQPLNFPSAGSTFKRPPGGFAAAMIDECGLKGFRIGGAAVSEKHAGFVVNLGDASFADVLHVINHVKTVVFEQTCVELVPEVRIIGGS